MGEFKDFPRTGGYYFTRRGKFKVIAIRGKMVTIEWQDNKDRVSIQRSELKNMLIPEAYSGDAEDYRQAPDTPFRSGQGRDEGDEGEEG